MYVLSPTLQNHDYFAVDLSASHMYYTCSELYTGIAKACTGTNLVTRAIADELFQLLSARISICL